jgi:hypothetical protein
MLRVQELTAADLAYFMKAKLEGNRGFLELRQIFCTKADGLVYEVARRSNGVFLWVSLVVKTLLQALTEGDGLPELQSILDQLPSDMERLYDAIWASISSRNIIPSTKLLVTFRAANGPLSYMTLWLADEEQPLDFNIGALTLKGRLSVGDIMRRE